jgi:hypothetical protein
MPPSIEEEGNMCPVIRNAVRIEAIYNSRLAVSLISAIILGMPCVRFELN